MSPQASLARLAIFPTSSWTLGSSLDRPVCVGVCVCVSVLVRVKVGAGVCICIHVCLCVLRRGSVHAHISKSACVHICVLQCVCNHTNMNVQVLF